MSVDHENNQIALGDHIKSMVIAEFDSLPGQDSANTQEDQLTELARNTEAHSITCCCLFKDGKHVLAGDSKGNLMIMRICRNPIYKEPRFMTLEIVNAVHVGSTVTNIVKGSLSDSEAVKVFTNRFIYTTSSGRIGSIGVFEPNPILDEICKVQSKMIKQLHQEDVNEAREFNGRLGHHFQGGQTEKEKRRKSAMIDGDLLFALLFDDQIKEDPLTFVSDISGINDPAAVVGFINNLYNIN